MGKLGTALETLAKYNYPSFPFTKYVVKMIIDEDMIVMDNVTIFFIFLVKSYYKWKYCQSVWIRFA